MAAAGAAHGANPLLLTNRLYKSRLSAAAGCAALASFLDIVALPSHRGAVWLEAVVSLLSLAGLVIACWAWLSLMPATRSAWAGYAGLDAESELALGWQRVLEVPRPPFAGARASRGTRTLFWLAYVPALEVSYRETAARYGAVAALHAVRARKAAFANRAASRAVTLFWLAYVNFYDGFGTWSRLLAFLLVVIGAEGVALACALIARRETAREVTRMTEVTGVPGLTARNLPWWPEEYLAWCDDRGLRPYPRGRQDWTDDDPEMAAAADA